MRPIESRKRADAYTARALDKGCAIRVMYMDECIANNSMRSYAPWIKSLKIVLKSLNSNLKRPNYFALVFQYFKH